ncbi:MAG: hypothetical protein JXR48_07170 [Candidatus Delongbacteria bacterium]|nr:hypothetical protein [Candidatus Delongbacteria bacterium]MBN2834732.1 hypothetical protein [Candidatus Delongbacteria bacterium]
MKKLVLVLTVLVAALSSFAMQVDKHNVEFKAELPNYSMQDKATTLGFVIPNVTYKYEAKANDMFKLYFHGVAGFNMSQMKYDGEVAEGADTFAKDMYIKLNPMGEYILPNDMFLKAELPFAYNNTTEQDEDADAIGSMTLNLDLKASYDKSKIDIELLSPWAAHEEGICVTAKFGVELMKQYDGEDAEEKDMNVGISGSYAMLNRDVNYTLKPKFDFTKHLNDKVDESMDVNVGLYYAQDFSKQFTLEGDLGVNMNKDNEDADMESTLNFEVTANYMALPNLDVFAGVGMSKWLTAEDEEIDDPTIMLKLGAWYLIDLK